MYLVRELLELSALNARCFLFRLPDSLSRWRHPAKARLGRTTNNGTRLSWRSAKNAELLIINCLRLEDHRKQFHYLAGRVPTSYRSEVNVFRTLGNPRPTAARQTRIAFTRNVRAVCPMASQTAISISRDSARRIAVRLK